SFMKNILAVFVLFIVLLSSCKKDPGTLQLNFQAMFGEEPIVLLKDYTYHDGSAIEFTKLDFYVSDISLVDSDNNTLQLSEIEFVDLSASHEDEQDASRGYPIRFNDLDANSYNTLRFSIGVPSDLNTKEPGEFESTHPLSKSSHYWNPWSSFIFAKTEGKIDSTGGNTPNLGFLQHSGKDELFRSFSVDVPITINEESTTEVTIGIDYKRLYGTSADFLDIRSKPIQHNPGDLSYPIEMADNYAVGIYVRQ
ncbi:MAG: MbnP family protein, partial [Bacteroidota bacterium]